MSFLNTAWYVNSGPMIGIYDLGSSSNAAGATLTLASVTVPAGALIVVAVTENSATANGTLGDGGTNGYSVAASQAMGGSAGQTQVFMAYNVTALSAATLTFTKNVSGSKCSISAFYATGVATSSPLDTAVTAAAAGTSSAPTVTSGAPSASGDLIVGVCGYSNASALTFTQAGGMAFLAPPDNTTAQPTASIGGGWVQYFGMNAVTYAPTLSGTPTGTATIILGFKPAASPSGYYGITPWASSTAYSAGALTRQNKVPTIGNERVFLCVVAGTSGSSEPTWTVTRGAKTTDNTVTWIEVTGLSGLNDNTNSQLNTPKWSASTSTALGQMIVDTTNAYLFICTTSSGNTGASAPSWVTTSVGSTTSDGSNVWTYLGTVSGLTKWAAPSPRMNTVLGTGYAAGGHTFYAGNTHAEVYYGNLGLAFPGNNRVLCANVTGSTPPATADLNTTASLTAVGFGYLSFTIAGGGSAGLYAYGLTFAGSSTTYGVALGGGYMVGTLTLESCAVVLLNPTGYFLTGSESGGGSSSIVLINTTVSFAGASGYISATDPMLLWKNTPSAIQGSVPTTLFKGASANDNVGIIALDGVDVSAAGAGKTLVGNMGGSIGVYFTNCKLGSGVTVASAPGPVWGGSVRVQNSDSSNTTYRQELYASEGTLTTDTTDVRSGGASDGVTPIAWKVATTASATIVEPFETFEIAKWCGATGSAITASIPILSNQTLTNAQIWLEAEYLGTSGYPVTSMTSGRVANLLPSTTAAAWVTDGASVWTTTGITGPVQQTLSVTFTPQLPGIVRIKVKIAAASLTVRIDPKIQGF